MARIIDYRELGNVTSVLPLTTRRSYNVQGYANRVDFTAISTISHYKAIKNLLASSFTDVTLKGSRVKGSFTLTMKTI